ncbi:hypothetical protein [Streptomyces europaeiscabiei]|uniref:hypothetical protein n=1 Tax=Streptomyces europaeiscabiei TaxID=146819 RepID=UPI000765EF32|nr:hypothetical protein [Streptomyces europaeiscabiei]MDX2757420.1 hypothetical protein [Streptomyces europaeiscabiei]MDX3867978.1 hypothetical protein [Streptomyces europaeiscabiei]
MTRTTPSALDLALVAEVGKLGFTISPTQLERWRTKLWLRRAADWTDAETGEIRPEIVHRAAWLANASKPGRSISWVGWIFWAIDDTPETATRLRAAVVGALERPFRRAGVDLGQVPEGDSNEAFEARRETAAGILKDRRCPRRDFDGILREGAAEAEFDLPPSRSVANMFHQALMDPGARMMVGGADDVGFDELMEAWETASPGNAELVGQIRAAHRDAALAGFDLFAQSPVAGGLRGLIRAVQEADDRTLCEAVRACTKGSGAVGILLMQRAQDEPEILRALMADEMWDQWVRVGGFVPVLGMGGEAAVAINVVQYLVIPGWAEGLERYQALMETLLAQPDA